MTPDFTIPPTERPHLGGIVVDLLRLVRTLRGEYRGCSTLLTEGLAMLRERDIEIDQLRDRYHQALDEGRQLRDERDRLRRDLSACRAGRVA